MYPAAEGLKILFSQKLIAKNIFEYLFTKLLSWSGMLIRIAIFASCEWDAMRYEPNAGRGKITIAVLEDDERPQSPALR